MDMGIVNAGQLAVYEEIPKDLLERVEDVLFDRRPDATERLIQFAETVKGQATEARGPDLSWRARNRGRAVSRTRSSRGSMIVVEDVEEGARSYSVACRSSKAR
jgi:5-methyltetrahydrofolate--homocysteine methyltransferase